MSAVSINVECGPGHAVIRFQGIIDDAAARDARPLLFGEIPSGCPNFIIDLAGVTFLDSHGVALFVTLLRKAHLNGGRLYLAGATGQPAAVLQMVGLSGALAVYCLSTEEALALVAGDKNGK